MKPFHVLLIAVILVACCHKDQPFAVKQKLQVVHSIATELKAFYDFTVLPGFLDSTICGQISSYDTTGKNDDGFSGTYSYLRRNADSSLVIFDRTGSGVINRIWTPTPTRDTLDFYIDSNRHPAFSIPFSDLFSGNCYPFVAPLCGNQLGGYYCYMPIPFRISCRIVTRGKKMQFHQIQYRMYEPGARVKSFSPGLSNEEKISLEKIAALWGKKEKTIKDFYSGDLAEFSKEIKIRSGETVPVFSLRHGGRILGLELSPAHAFEGYDKNIYIKITWDGEKIPAVYCPVADFFGYAFGNASMQSLLLGSIENKNYCYFPMPFDREAKIELTVKQPASDVAPVTLKVWYTSEKRLPGMEGKFYVYWNNNQNAARGKPHIFLNYRGKGHYVGTILQAQGLQAGMTYFFEGDDSASIDGEFRIHGTGSEDYFNGGWYAMMDRWDGKLSLPLHGALEYSLPFCRTGGFRLYLSDKLSFEKSFLMSIEHGPAGNKIPVNYISLAFYYSNMPAEQYTEPLPEMTRVFLPDTLILYPQLLDYNLYGNMEVETSWKYGTGGESYLFTPNGDSWLRISMAGLPYNKYNLYFDIMKEPFGCDFSVWQRQTRISEWISTYSPAEERAKLLYVSGMEIGEQKSTMTIRFKTGKIKTGFLLNRIILVKKSK